MPQDLLDYVTLRWLEEGDDFHLAGTTRADQRVDLENPFDQHRPSLAGAAAGRRRFGGRTGRASRLLRRSGFGLLPPQTSTLVRVPAVITNQVRALGWNYAE